MQRKKNTISQQKTKKKQYKKLIKKANKKSLPILT